MGALISLTQNEKVFQFILLLKKGLHIIHFKIEIKIMGPAMKLYLMAIV